MVSGDNFSDPILKPRQAFSDVTNRPHKRPISSISADSFPQSSDGFPKIDANTSDSQQFGKKPRLQGFTDSAPENDKFTTSMESSKFPPLERCVRLKGDGGENNSIQNDGLLKGCSCTFCSTAGYIWSDLHYQDLKGRLSALRKSQKEASSMVQRISGVKDSVIQSQRNSTESLNLELNLMDQWRSLFLHMENTLAHETNQLESSFEKLKDLRESCKNDLEKMEKRCHNY